MADELNKEEKQSEEQEELSDEQLEDASGGISRSVDFTRVSVDPSLLDGKISTKNLTDAQDDLIAKTPTLASTTTTAVTNV